MIQDEAAAVACVTWSRVKCCLEV